LKVEPALPVLLAPIFSILLDFRVGPPMRASV
jgi:hypothetical protein